MMAGNSLGAAGGDASIVSGLSSISSGRILTLALGDGNTSGGAVTIDGGDGSTAWHGHKLRKRGSIDEQHRNSGCVGQFIGEHWTCKGRQQWRLRY